MISSRFPMIPSGITAPNQSTVQKSSSTVHSSPALLFTGHGDSFSRLSLNKSTTDLLRRNLSQRQEAILHVFLVNNGSTVASKVNTVEEGQTKYVAADEHTAIMSKLEKLRTNSKDRQVAQDLQNLHARYQTARQAKLVLGDNSSSEELSAGRRLQTQTQGYIRYDRQGNIIGGRGRVTIIEIEG